MSTGKLLHDMRFTLYDWAPSPFCLKVRALLDYKKITYTRVPALGRPLYDMWRRGGTGKLPALDVDGELVCDSTEIAHVVERRAPDPPVLPRDRRERALCHALEDWADEALYFVGLYFHWWHPEGRARTPKAFGKSPLGRAVFLAYERRVRGQLRGQGIARKSPAMVEADLARNLDAAEGLLDGRPWLLGDRPYLCDFALASQLVYLRWSPVGARAIDARAPLGAYLDRFKALR